MGPTWVEMVLGPFADTKGPRLPGRTPALPIAKLKPQHIEKNGNGMWRNDFVPVGLNLMNIVWQDLTTAMSQAEGTSALNSQQQTCPLFLTRPCH
jgi:hypothetical protein